MSIISIKGHTNADSNKHLSGDDSKSDTFLQKRIDVQQDKIPSPEPSCLKKGLSLLGTHKNHTRL